MKKNVAGVDRILRGVIGVGLILWAFISGNAWGYIGIIPLFTAIVSWCPAYVPFGISSCNCCCSKEGSCSTKE